MEAVQPQAREDVEKSPAGEDLMASLIQQVPEKEEDFETSQKFKKISPEVEIV